MKRIFVFFALFALSLSAFGQTVTVMDTRLGGPRPITGVITFQPALTDGTPASTMLSGGGITSVLPLTATVTAGAFTLPNVTDTAAANPANLCYKVTVRLTNGLQGLGPGYSCVQPAYNNSWCSNGVCDFGRLKPALASQALTVTGPGSYGKARGTEQKRTA